MKSKTESLFKTGLFITGTNSLIEIDLLNFKKDLKHKIS